MRITHPVITDMPLALLALCVLLFVAPRVRSRNHGGIARGMASSGMNGARLTLAATLAGPDQAAGNVRKGGGCFADDGKDI